MAYIGNTPSTQAFPFDQFSGTGAQTSFTLTYPAAGSSSILTVVAGVVQNPTTYAVVGNALNFSEAPPAGSNNIVVLYLGMPSTAVTTPGNSAYRWENETVVATGGTSLTIGTSTYTPGFVEVYRNGVKLAQVDFTATTGSSVVVGAQTNDIITIVGWNLQNVANALPLTGGTVAGQVTLSKGDLVVNAGSVVIGTVGSLSPGCIYSDANWGMLMRSKQTTPNTAEFVWQNANGSANRMMILPSGNLSCMQSVLTPGIQFPAAQTVSGDPNCLDDYEEGMWTPNIQSGANFVMANVFSASYTKVGRIVHCYCYINVRNNNASALTANIGGMPFTCQQGYGFAIRYYGPGGFQDGNTYVEGGQNYIISSVPYNAGDNYIMLYACYFTT